MQAKAMQMQNPQLEFLHSIKLCQLEENLHQCRPELLL